MHKLTRPQGYKEPVDKAMSATLQARPKSKVPWRLGHLSKDLGTLRLPRQASKRDRSARKARREEQRRSDRATALNATEAKPKRIPSRVRREKDRMRAQRLRGGAVGGIFPMFDPAVHTVSPTEWQEHPGIDQDRVYGVNLNEAVVIDGSMLDASAFDGTPGEIVLVDYDRQLQDCAMNVTEAIQRDKNYFDVVTPFGEMVESSMPNTSYDQTELREVSNDK